MSGEIEQSRILIVDDTPTNLKVLFDFLADSGFRVLVARDGESAIQKSQYALPDLILLDVLMPGIDGFETCRNLKADASTKDIPVIFMTALSEPVDKIRGLNLGAVDYITKPLEPEEVLARVKLHLSLRNLTKKLQEQNQRLEQELQERQLSEQKIREQAVLLDIATDAILVRDLDNRILFWNKGAERLYGWQAEEAIGQKAEELLYPEPPSQLQNYLKILAETGEWQGELHQVTKDGKEIVVDSRWTLVRSEAEQPKSILTVNTDITQKKQLEAQFLRAQRLESIGRLSGGIAHDLNNILTPILTSAQLLQLKLPEADQLCQQMFEIIENNAKRGAAVVKQVLSFARGIESDRIALTIGHLILEIQKIAKHTFPKSIEFETEIPQDLWSVFGDATQLEQVLMNLCVNASDAMPNGGTLRISAENLFVDEAYIQINPKAQVGPYVVVNVADTGTGIPPEIIEKIFEPFFTTKDPGKGTGLGLATVVAIVESHKGFVNVYSELGGTQFKIYLPAVQGTGTQPATELELFPGHGELILVVDDEATIREIIKTALETYNYKVLTASDGIEAIALYARHQTEVSAVLVDMLMPLMDGATTIRTLSKINPLVKIIAVSGLIASDEQLTSVKAFLVKPYTAKELLQTLHSVLSCMYV